MADGEPRSAAEKLAAAKKKHRAYLKEKGLKNSATKNCNTQSGDGISQPISTISTFNFEETTEKSGTSCDIPVKTEITAPETNALGNLYEADLPLPQYSMDYNSQSRNTSLPDPLSFFDNLSNVGATFQNFAQPLASFFNNTHSSHDYNSVDSPNQIVVGEDTSEGAFTEKAVGANDKIENLGITQEIFSYDKFKNNAINSDLKDVNKDVKNILERKDIFENRIFDQFTNSNDESDFQNQASSFNNKQNNPISFRNNLADIHGNIQENLSNELQAIQEINKNQNIQENNPIQFEVKEEESTCMNIENTNVDYNRQNVNVKETENPFNPNIQGLQKLTAEMEEVINEAHSSPYLSNMESNGQPEKNKNELFSLLDQQDLKCAQLSLQLQESEMKYSKLLMDFRTLEIQKEENETGLKLNANFVAQNELSKLREDLQCHLQTIGMLVAEKTELSSIVNETQLALRNESSQNIDLQNKIKEMKLFYSDLERELEILKSEKVNLSSTQREQEDIHHRTREDFNKIKVQYEELMQDLSQSKEKIKSLTDANSNLENQVRELGGQLSLANIKIQQLTLGEASQQEIQVEKLMQEKFAYEKQISYLNDTLKTISKEREDSSLQYQQYAEQLNGQISNLAAKLEHYQKENEQLKIQEENRVRHIGELEKQLQNVQKDNTSLNLQKNNIFLKKELESSSELLKQLHTEKDELHKNFNKVLIDKELLEKELDQCKFSIGHLETTVEQLRGSQPDNAVLLATMESDKIAASRAISQNNELKQQLEGMQEVLLKVNNDNVQLTENMSLERRTNKDLLEKLQKTEISFQTLAEAIEIKDKELVNLREHLERMGKQVVQQEQLSDRLRHYEAQDHSSQSLQNELQNAKQIIAHLTNELNILKKNQLNQENQINRTDQNTQINQNSENGSDNPDVLNELRTQLSNLQIRNKELESLLVKMPMTESKNTDTNGNENLDRETAMEHLEKKFLRTMEEIARLTEEKQRLEHLVLQLQGETETIGEYVTLYQQQRSILKQKALEKDQQLQQLTNDRENIKGNLDRLNNLVNKLIVEKGAITKELLEQHEHFSKERDDLCAEHQKIHQEINKITNDSLKDSRVSDNSNTEIAEEIISLLSEIKSSNLVQPAESIHHCPWCSGKLITV